MSEFRNSDDLVTAVTELRARVADMESTLMMRTSRRPTGDIEPTLLKTPKPNTFFLQGQTISRVDYPVLWQYVVDNNLIDAARLFGPGDGTTTFVLPDFTGYAIVGANDSGWPVGIVYGADEKLITISNLPSHTHKYTDPGAGYADYSGGHNGHIGGGFVMNNGTGGTADLASRPGQSVGDHWHPIVNGSTGGNTLFNVVQASKTVNWLIYT